MMKTEGSQRNKDSPLSWISFHLTPYIFQFLEGCPIWLSFFTSRYPQHLELHLAHIWSSVNSSWMNGGIFCFCQSCFLIFALMKTFCLGFLKPFSIERSVFFFLTELWETGWAAIMWGSVLWGFPLGVPWINWNAQRKVYLQWMSHR